MVSSAPSISFNPSSISFGVVDVGTSTAKKTYHVRNKSGSYATAKNCSISFLGSTNASEAKTGSWVYESTATEAAYVKSVGGAECAAPSVLASYGKSIRVATKVKVPASPTTSGTVLFKHHFRYQYTG
jgi:hypothetical protein